jgi:hypothetical protein
VGFVYSKLVRHKVEGDVPPGRSIRYAAEQQYYVYLNSNTITTSWQAYVKNFAPDHSFDNGNRAAAL